ncbi:MAG TPA: hypothetical protein VIE65_14255, partial [Methylobacter sp.]
SGRTRPAIRNKPACQIPAPTTLFASIPVFRPEAHHDHFVRRNKKLCRRNGFESPLLSGNCAKRPKPDVAVSRNPPFNAEMTVKRA